LKFAVENSQMFPHYFSGSQPAQPYQHYPQQAQGQVATQNIAPESQFNNMSFMAMPRKEFNGVLMLLPVVSANMHLSQNT
jgi:hypothetical protein